MAGTISFDRELAEKLYDELITLMHDYDDTDSHYVCRFCYHYCGMAGSKDREIKEISHSSDCIGEKALKELDVQLRMP